MAVAAVLLELRGLNPTGGHGCLCVVRYRSLHRADHSSRGVIPSAVCLNAIVKPR